MPTLLMYVTHTILVNHLQQPLDVVFGPSDSTSRLPCPLVPAFPNCSFFGSFLAGIKKKMIK